MTRTCLVSLFHPGNALAAMAAVKWYGMQRCDDGPVNVITVIHCPGLSDNDLGELGIVIEQLITSQGWNKPRIITTAEIEKNTDARHRSTYNKKIKQFKEIIGVNAIDEFYYTIEMGIIQELAMNAYPNAKHITFGDAMGQLYEMEFHMNLASGRSNKTPTRKSFFSKLRYNIIILSNYFKDSIEKCLFGGSSYHRASIAVLILPMDQTGTCLLERELLIVPKTIVSKIIHESQQNLYELNRYCNKLLSNINGPCYLLMIDNIADGKFTSFEQEVLFYDFIIRKYVPKGSTLFIKAHPLSVLPVDEALSDRLSSEYTCDIISKKFSRYPIEFWSTLIEHVEVISISYPSISLSYLYHKQAIYPLETYLIEKFIFPQFWDSFKNGDNLYRGILTNLNTWDGNNVIWCGDKS